MVVIFGWGDARAKDRGEIAPTTCPQCHNDVFMHQVHSEKQFSLYFVPLSSYGGKEYLVCPICHFGLPLQQGHKATVDKMRAATGVFRRGRVPAEAYRQTVDQFWAIMGRNAAGQQMLAAPASLGQATAPSASSAPPGAKASASTKDMAAQLAELGKLHAAGTLTEAEFAAAKRRLLGS